MLDMEGGQGEEGHVSEGGAADDAGHDAGEDGGTERQPMVAVTRLFPKHAPTRRTRTVTKEA
ncbi:hypothetical protein GCM10023177_09740 [Streptomyces violaceoruber]